MTSHLSLTLLRLVLRGRISPRDLSHREHRHLLELCAACDVESSAGPDEGGFPQPLPPRPLPGTRGRSLPANDRYLSYADLEERLLQQSRRARMVSRARRHLNLLLQTPPAERQQVIEKAVSRFRTRAFAELLIVESRARVRSDPREAACLAALVPVVVSRIPGSREATWAEELKLLGSAWEANAQRVTGQLNAAQQIFTAVQQQLKRAAATSPEILGQILSLEASLRIDQRQPRQAHELLNRAAALFRAAEDLRGQIRVVVKRANLHLNQNEPRDALSLLDEAATIMSTTSTDWPLHLMILNSRVLALFDLARYNAAGELLGDFQKHLDGSALEPHDRAVFESLQGRVAASQGDLDQAEASFTACREINLDLHRYYDAALASLDLAQVYLESGRYQELQQLAADLVPQFQARGVGRETLAALRLLSEAVAARQLTGDLLRRLRDRVQGRTRPTADS